MSSHHDSPSSDHKVEFHTWEAKCESSESFQQDVDFVHFTMNITSHNFVTMHANNFDTTRRETDEISPSHVSEQIPSLRGWESFVSTWYQLHCMSSHHDSPSSDHKVEFHTWEAECESSESFQQDVDFLVMFYMNKYFNENLPMYCINFHPRGGKVKIISRSAEPERIESFRRRESFASASGDSH